MYHRQIRVSITLHLSSQNIQMHICLCIRESDKEKIIRNVDEKDIAEHLRIRLKKEQEEKEHKKKEKAEALLCTIIKVAQNEELAEQIGREIYFDLVDHDKVCSFRNQKQMPLTFHASCNSLWPGVTIVVCPLLSLIHDQTITLNLKFAITATFLNSQQTTFQASAIIRELRKKTILHANSCTSRLKGLLEICCLWRY